MKNTFFSNKYLIFLLSLLSPMVISIGGEVSPTLLFIAGTSPFWIRNIDLRNDSILRYNASLFLIIIIVQIIWFPFAKTDDLSQIKGLLITISGLMHFLFYYFVFRCNLSILKWAILGTFLSNFIFINPLAEVAGNEYGLWKFHTFPHIVFGCIFIYIWFCDNKYTLKLSSFVLTLVGALGILTGARSSGIVPFTAGLFAFMILSHKRSISIRKILKNIVITSVTFYSLYAFFYVPNVLNGNIQGGNSLQLKATENPYNPINLLMVGRSDAIIPFLAFFDKPLTGWGYMTKDPNKKYYRMELKISNRKERKLKSDYREQTIPAHSAWGYYSCSYGIVVFIAMFLMLLQLWKYVLLSLVNSDKYLLYRLWAVLSVTWNFLFSPMSHFKWSLPTTIAIILVLSTTAIKEYVNNNFLSNETKNFSNNPNFRKS